MEPLQYPPGVEHAGRVRDPALAALLRDAGLRERGAVRHHHPRVGELTSRSASGRPCIEVDLRHLNREAGIAYLRQLGVNGERRRAGRGGRGVRRARAGADAAGHAAARLLRAATCAAGARPGRWRKSRSKGAHAGARDGGLRALAGRGAGAGDPAHGGAVRPARERGRWTRLRASAAHPRADRPAVRTKAQPLQAGRGDRAVLRLRKARLLDRQTRP